MIARAGLAALGALIAATAQAEPRLITLRCACSYEVLLERVHKAIDANGMKVIAEASPTATAAAQGFTVPGDTVAMVFRNDFARRIIAVAPESMIEPPIRLHIRALSVDSSSLEYYRPSDLFGRYQNRALTPIAAELDQIFEKITTDAMLP